MATPQEIKQLEARLAAHQIEFDSDDGGLLQAPIETITAAQLNSHAIAVRQKDPLRFAAIQRQILKSFVQQQMIRDLDFGVIPGTDKPGLYKAGAEKLTTLFNLRTRVNLQNSVEDWDKPLFSYDYQCTVLDCCNQILAQCEANCNSREKKYRYRSLPVEQATDEQLKTCQRVGKPIYVPEFKATPEEKARATSSEIKRSKNGNNYKVLVLPGEAVLVPNPEIFDQVNTIKKMSQKRAIVGGVLLAVNASAFFGNMEAELEHDVDSISLTSI